MPLILVGGICFAALSNLLFFFSDQIVNISSGVIGGMASVPMAAGPNVPSGISPL